MIQRAHELFLENPRELFRKLSITLVANEVIKCYIANVNLEYTSYMLTYDKFYLRLTQPIKWLFDNVGAFWFKEI